MSSSLPAFGSGSGTPSWASNRGEKKQRQGNVNEFTNANTNGSLYQQTSGPVDTPPNNSFASGTQFNSSSNMNSLFQRGQNQNTTPTIATSTKSTTPLQLQQTQTRGHGHGMSNEINISNINKNNNDNAGGFDFSSTINNPIKAATIDHSSLFGGPTLDTPTFGLAATSSYQTGSAHDHSQNNAQPQYQSQFGVASSSALGLRQRNIASRGGLTGATSRVGAPPPKRSMMNMNVNMNMAAEKSFQNHAQSDKENIHISSMTNSKSDATESDASMKKICDNNSNNATSNSQAINPFAQSPMDYNQWIVIYGFSTSSQCQVILSKFDKLGTVVAQFPSLVHDSSDEGNGRNWVCIKYQSVLQADKALCQHGSLMDMHGSHAVTRGGGGAGQQPMIVGVMNMDEVIASRLGLNLFLKADGGSVGTGAVNFKGNGRLGGAKGQPTVVGTGRMRTTTTKLHERDVLLTTGREDRKHSGNNDAILAERDSLCYKALAWVFEW
eukprot:scaffold1521_cov271-Chaetoceros_neogracile.AAC.22